jgi:hypothetical protein
MIMENVLTNGEVLLYEEILFNQMNITGNETEDTVKLKDLKNFKLQYCLDRNFESIQKEAKRIRGAIEKIQTEKHKELSEKFIEEFKENIYQVGEYKV